MKNILFCFLFPSIISAAIYPIGPMGNDIGPFNYISSGTVCDTPHLVASLSISDTAYNAVKYFDLDTSGTIDSIRLIGTIPDSMVIIPGTDTIAVRFKSKYTAAQCTAVVYGCTNDTLLISCTSIYDTLRSPAVISRRTDNDTVYSGDSLAIILSPLQVAALKLDSAEVGDSTAAIFDSIMDDTAGVIMPDMPDTGLYWFVFYAPENQVCSTSIYYAGDYVPDSSTLTLTQNTGGTVSAEPAAAKRQAGDQSVITATPDAGYIFVGWGGDLADSTGSSFTYNYPSSGTFTGYATFIQNIPLIDSIRPGPKANRNDSCTARGVRFTNGGVIRNITAGADAVQKAWTSTQIDFYTALTWPRGWNMLVFTNSDSLRDTAGLYITIPRKTN